MCDNMIKYYEFCEKLLPIIEDLRIVYIDCIKNNKQFNLTQTSNTKLVIESRSKLFYNMYIRFYDKKTKYDYSEFYKYTGCVCKYQYFINILCKEIYFNYTEIILKNNIDLQKELKNIHIYLRNKYIVELVLKGKM